MLFYFYTGPRDVISAGDPPSEEFMLNTSIEAPDWLAAKAALGFELTPLQQQMLPLDEAGRMLAQQADVNYGRAAPHIQWRRSV